MVNEAISHIIDNKSRNVLKITSDIINSDKGKKYLITDQKY